MEYKRYKNSNYLIYEDGRCWSEKTQKFLTPKMTVRYPTYHLSLANGQKTIMIHRMVAETFLPNPSQKEYVNHIDGNIHNYCLQNLEWTTAKENSQHAVVNQLIKPSHYKKEKSLCIQQLDNSEEKWVKVKDYPNYLISSYGRIINKKTKQVKKNSVDNHGYFQINLWKNGKGKTFQVHKLVYSSFFSDDILNGYVINHIDGNKLNNKLSNLEKITYQQNNSHAEYISKQHSCRKPVGQFKSNELIREYLSIAEAQRITGIKNISRAIKNNSFAGGYNWKFFVI